MLQRRVPIRPDKRRISDPAMLVANAQRAHDELGWTPRHTGLEQVIRLAVAWERARDGLSTGKQDAPHGRSSNPNHA